MLYLGTVLPMCCGIFSCWSDHNYEIICTFKVPIPMAPGYFIKKAVWHDRDELSLTNLLVSCSLSLFSGVAELTRDKKQNNRWTPEKDHLVFRQGLDQRQNEHQKTQLPKKSKQLFLKPPMKLFSQENPFRTRFYTVFRYLTKCVYE